MHAIEHDHSLSAGAGISPNRMHTVQTTNLAWVKKFVSDRANGWQAEDELIRRLSLLGVQAHRNPATDLDGKRANDIVIDNCPYPWLYTSGQTIEVKTDFMWNKTGFVAIEWKAMRDSKSDYVSYFIGDSFWEQTRHQLILLVWYDQTHAHKWKHGVSMGDFHNLGTLIPVHDFIEQCRSLGPIPT